MRIQKKRIKEVAAENNYVPNPIAVNLRSKKSATIAVIVPRISNSFFARILAGIEDEAQRQGMQIITYNSNESLEREKQIATLLSSGFVDGIMVAFSEETQQKRDFVHLLNLSVLGIPLVLFDRTQLEIPVDKIGIDDEQSIYNATEYLIKKGVTKIALASSIQDLEIGRLRIEGYKQAIKNENDILIVGSLNEEILRVQVKKILLEEEVEALICTDFESTMMCYRLSYECKIDIPQELKLIGFLNEQIASLLAPSISYIEQFPEEMGKKGFQLLLDRIRKPSINGDFKEERISTELIHLESTRFNTDCTYKSVIVL